MEIRIGFDDDNHVFDELEEMDEKSVGIDRQTESLSVDDIFVSPERLKYIKSLYHQGVVVNNFGDDYHITEEQKRKNNEYYEVFKPLRRSKRKYRKITEWVIVMREYMKAIKMVADNNQVYSPEKFMEKYSKGKIKINGITFPKYVGKDKKDINWEYVWTEFIATDRDPNELIRAESIIDDSLEDMRNRLFTKEEFERITAPMTDEERFRISHVPMDEEQDDIDGINVVFPSGKKIGKQFVKEFPEISAMIKESRKQEVINRGLTGFVSDLTMDDIEFLDRYDKKHNFTIGGDAPKFDGDMSDDNVNAYLYRMNEYLESHIQMNYGGKMRTLEDINEIKIREFLDEAGYNIRNCFGNRDEEKRIKKIVKRDRKAEKRLRRRLMDIDRRKKSSEYSDGSYGGRKKKKSKDSDEDD